MITNTHTKSPRILVTGACGFAGTAIVQRALGDGLSVRRTDRLQTNNCERTEYIQADILRPATLKPAFAGIDAVIHAAGLAHVFGKSKLQEKFSAVNELGTANVVQAASEAGVKNFILISSVSVYGGPGSEDAPCQPRDAYAQSKYQAEIQAARIVSQSGMNLTILRMATIYGEGDPGNLARLIRTIDKGRFLWIGKGSNRKSLLYKDDMAAACMAALLNPAPGIRIFNVSAPACTMRLIVETIAMHLGRKLPQWHIPTVPALGCTALAAAISLGRGPAASIHRTIRKWLSDEAYPADRIRSSLGFQTQTSLTEGLHRQIAWYRNTIAPTASCRTDNPLQNNKK